MGQCCVSSPKPGWRRAHLDAGAIDTARGAFAGHPDQSQPWRAGIMRSILLWFLGVPIPIIILIALLYR